MICPPQGNASLLKSKRLPLPAQVSVPSWPSLAKQQNLWSVTIRDVSNSAHCQLSTYFFIIKEWGKGIWEK